MGLRHKSIRFRVLLLVLVPLVSLIGVYSYATTGAVRSAVRLVRAGTVANVTITPTSNLMKQLDAERSLAVTYLVSPTSQALSDYNRQQARTSAALKKFEGVSMSGPIAANASPLEKAMAATLINATRSFPGLVGLRANVASNGITRQTAVSEYSALVHDGYRVIYQAIQKTGISESVVTTALQQTNMDEAGQLLLQESDLYAGDAATGSFPPADRTQFAQLVGLRRFLIAEALPQLDATSRGLYSKYVSPSTADTLAQLENTITRTPARRGVPQVPLQSWASAVTGYGNGLTKMLNQGTVALVAQVKSSAQTSLIGLIVAGGLGLLAIILSVLFSVIIGRGLLRQLRELRQSALELANDRLPDVMKRLRDGQTVDVAAESPPVESSADEIDQVRQAFNIVQRTAIEAAVDEANLRRGVSDVFRNLARRSQVLLHRQLRLLDGMERRASEPEELEDLFRIDHLTTRMRRHAEGLIILSGESPGRAWRQPVPMLDVLRAAVAEVEDYTRIRVEVRSKAALAGPAVADVIHLIAELAENATVFSPPNTPVRIQGDIVGRGFAVEVEDRGLGITEERMAEINRNLSSPPVFDLSGSDRLGLFIAGRLAARHDIKITLRPSAFGGTSAIVIIPTSLVVEEGAYEQVRSIGLEGRGLPQNGRPAALAEGHGGNGGGNGNGGGPRDNGSPPGAGPGSFWSPAPRSTGTALPPAEPPEPAEAEAAPGGLAPVTALPGREDGWPGSQLPWAQPVFSGPDRALDADGLDSGGATAELRALNELDDLGDVGDLGELELPVRVRQASLAPQLRDTRKPADRPAPEPRQASPEAARNTMAALQRGWELGRSSDPDLPPDPGAAPQGNGATDGAGQ
ncbi:MAG TPA: sensor histidine kinase [Streptosporangiaceae bacterium]|jgi:signal transduction histidine kinase